jgi:LytS/YehU family sensor histidine kinase
VQTVGSLASLLRQSLRTDAPQLVPLEIELRYVSQYLALQTMRFRNRLRVETLVTSEAGAALVPALSVHSLVQEAVARRMSGPGACHVRLHGSCLGGRVHVELVLDGPGAADELEAPVNALSLRLERLYGDRYDLDTQYSPDGATTVRIRIPESLATV